MAKRHPFVPVTYLKGFTDRSGMLHVYRKDAPDKPFRQRPEATGYERRYYAQVSDDGERDDTTLEAYFSEVESHWPKILGALRDGQREFPEAPQLIVFMALLRVRGPAYRDAAELHLADLTLGDLHRLLDAGELPAPPSELAGRLDELRVAIDPQMSLIAMAGGMKNIASLLESLSYDVLHNKTATGFLTSDNPVMYYDSRQPVLRMQPYNIIPGSSRIELILPLSKDMLLRGRSTPVRTQIGHKSVRESATIRRFNRVTARFAYRAVYAPDSLSSQIVCQNAALSPVPRFDKVALEKGSVRLGQMVFGPRSSKLKW